MIMSSFNESNGWLDKPKEMPEDICDPISVCFSQGVDHEVPVIISCWKLTKEELELIKKTGRVWLTIIGPTMPPASLTVEKPIDEAGRCPII